MIIDNKGLPLHSGSITLVKPQSVGAEAVDKVRKILGKKFSAKGKIPGKAKYNVVVLYPAETSKKKDLPIVMYAGVTYDNIQWRIEFDFRQFSSDYIAETIGQLSDQIQQHRQKRSPIILP